MKILFGAVPAYMVVCGWATLLGGVAALLVTIAVLAPFSAFGVVVLFAQQQKYEREDRYELPARSRRPIAGRSWIG